MRCMSDLEPTESPVGQPNSSSSRIYRLGRRTLAALVRNWHDTRYLNERLLDARRPWEQQGPLRWRHEPGRWRLLGSCLPDDPTASWPG
jgi:hypothetical protein